MVEVVSMVELQKSTVGRRVGKVREEALSFSVDRSVDGAAFGRAVYNTFHIVQCLYILTDQSPFCEIIP